MRFIDVSDWQVKISSTKGTRDKGVLIDPETGNEYFIKFPMIRDNRDYSMETWSEIIAYEVGTMLGFNVLRYDFAIKDNRPGCISKNMISNKNEESLVEGDSILTGYDPLYNPSDKGMYVKYTFPFVIEALKNLNLGQYIPEFLKMLIFDAIIGNSDRHQSNWGFILKVTLIKKRPRLSIRRQNTIENSITYTMAPIYDSGCCLGREFDETQINDRLNDSARFNAFINKGYAELRIIKHPNKKVSHFELLNDICCQYPEWHDCIIKHINDVIKLYDLNKLESLIYSIDNPLPSCIKSIHGLSNCRKQFVIKVIDKRINELKKIPYAS